VSLFFDGDRLRLGGGLLISSITIAAPTPTRKSPAMSNAVLSRF
jgi:hypothetical protein